MVLRDAFGGAWRQSRTTLQGHVETT
jgi:hypothetical protein